MKITTQWLNKWEACDAGIEYYKAHAITDPVKLAKQLLADGKLDWCNWGVARYLPRKKRILYAVYAAKLGAKYYNERYPGDNRINDLIAAAERVAQNDTAANRRAAEDAAKAADRAAKAATWAAIWAAVAAARAAEDAALAATWAATRAARAAEAAAGDAARNSALRKIVKYGISLLEDGR